LGTSRQDFSQFGEEDNELPTFSRIRRHKPALEEEKGQQRTASKRQRRSTEEVFKCRHCRRFVVPLSCGGSHRNHCPYCLYSRHVDGQRSGDRLSSCGESMQPLGQFQRPNGEHVIVHRCLGCGLERFNRIAADDDFELVLSLPAVTPRTSRDMKLKRWSIFAQEWSQQEWQVEDQPVKDVIL
jgi:RNHCP domain